MWIEAKIALDVFAFIFMGIVMAFMIAANQLLLFFLLLMAFGLVVFSDLLYGWVTNKWWVKPWFESAKSNQEVGVEATISGGVAARFVDIRAEGKREWVQNKKEASCINHGDYQLRTPNGNPAFLCHEDHDENINLNEARYATELVGEFGTDKLQDVYHLAKEKDIEWIQPEKAMKKSKRKLKGFSIKRKPLG